MVSSAQLECKHLLLQRLASHVAEGEPQPAGFRARCTNCEREFVCEPYVITVEEPKPDESSH